jgi:hypothetical protein
MGVNNFYEAQDMFPAQRIGIHGFLTTTVMSQSQTCDLKCTLENLGVVGDYVELTGSARFQQLLNQFKINTAGLLRTITALSPQEQHIIVPLLLKVREFSNIKDDDIIHSGSFKISDDKYDKPSAWRYSETYQSFNQWVNKETHFYVMTRPSIKLLPLISGIKVDYGRRGLTMALGQIDWKTNKGIPFGFDATFYQDMANFLSTDELTTFGYNEQFEHESDMELTIKPFARVIRHLKNLNTFKIHGYIGVKNLEYLIDHGLAVNQSITELNFSYIEGDYPISLIGKLLSRNTTLKILYIPRYNITNISDFECFNELARGLEKNNSLEILRINFQMHRHTDPIKDNWPDWCLGGMECPFPPIRPLPGRPRGSCTSDFSIFKNAVMKSNLKNITVNNYKSCVGLNHSADAFMNMINGINKPDLKKYVS